ncbi:HAD family hydrolase [Dysgonomonas sp. 520]|uniref:HAD family hydrolase n=1 Tax=Dysgonomonas sp. 520 TaxID=2302931 RepID=UPI0013D8C60D|nr:HAD family hydrolase [Dysgonomonas sp. 520]NDW10510.1 HAD family hydrolase [Dysgonomonas sp. 520]
MITNVSFDLWLTLIKSHPEFKHRRAEMIADTYNSKGLSVPHIEALVRNIDKIFDRYNEYYGEKIPASSMYQRVLNETCNDPEEVSLEEAQHFEQRANELFVEYSPRLLNDDIPSILEGLQAEGKVLNLASNTGFIEGKTLRIVLEKLGILKHFLFNIFSDEVKASKPSARFFQRVYDEVSVPKKNILHVGDNEKTDYQGALNFGFSALLIKPDYTLNDIRAAL